MQAKFGLTRSTTLTPLVLALAALGAGCDPAEVEPAVSPEPVVTPAPADTPPATAETPAPVVGAADAVSVADITSDWTDYEGKQVTVVAQVEEIKGPSAFLLDEDAALQGGIDSELLVLAPKAGALTALDDEWLTDKVRVTGVVHQFVTAEVEREVGWDLDPEIEAEYGGEKPVLIATAIERVAP